MLSLSKVVSITHLGHLEPKKICVNNLPQRP